MMRHRTAIAALVAAGALGGCALDEPEGDGRNQQVEYRSGTDEDGMQTPTSGKERLA